MKKTLLITLDFFPTLGGVSRYWISLGKEMPSHKWAVLAPSLKKGQTELACAYKIYRSPFFFKFLFPQWLPLVLALWGVILRERPNVMIAAQVLPVGTAVFLVSKITGIPYIVSTHGMDVTLPLAQPRKMKLCGRIFRNAKKIITVSRYTSAKIQTYGVGRSKIGFIFPCHILAPQDAPLEYPASKKECILLTVGRLVKRKGHEYVIEALSRLRHNNPPIYYVVVGDGPQKEHLVRLAKDSDVGDRVLFSGSLADEAVKQWYKKCDIFIMTPYEIEGDVEGFGIVYLEANAFGKPVIAARSGGVEDAVEDGISGLLVEPQDVSGICDAIAKLCSDIQLRRRLGEQGRERVKKEFQWSVQSEKLKKIISEI